MIHHNVHNLPINQAKAFDLVARCFSFASFEVLRFIGPDTTTWLANEAQCTPGWITHYLFLIRGEGLCFGNW